MSACISIAEKPYIVAHRGASNEAPENTRPAFKLAWEQGADAIEGDFYLTKDGRIVCIHDGNTKRVAGTNLVIAASTFAELRALDVGRWKGERYRSTVIPSVEEVFALVPDSKGIYVEIKCGPEIIPEMLKILTRSGLKDEQVTFICFKKEVIRELKRVAPHYRAFWLCSLKRDKAENITPTLEQALATLREIKADGFSSSLGNLSDGYVQGIIAAGFEWHVWTVDNPEAAKRCVRLGAKSITTNVPGEMIRVLND
ncbi:MAG: glycerophosphodiester phosphodiesterase [Kiritimatiellia bacterium]